MNFIDLLKPIIPPLVTSDLTCKRNSWEKGFSKTTNKQSQTNDRNRQIQSTTKDNRHCPFCGCNVIEDEVHFLLQCPTHSMIRNKFYYKVKTLIPNITQLAINVLINKLMNSSNYLINIH